MNIPFKRIRELNNDLIIREAISSDASGFIHLMNNHYRRQKNEKYFFWRFFSCPTPSILFVVTNKENVIIGAYGLNVFTLTNGQKCGLAVDLIISGQYINRGLFYLLEDKITRFAKKNKCSYILCFPNSIGMKTHTKVEGWKMLRSIPMLTVTPNNIKQILHIPKFTSDKKVVSFVYTKDLLNWRFNESPEYKYSHIKSDDSESFIKIFQDPIKNIALGDLVYYKSPYSSKSEFSRLIDLSIQKLWAMGAQKITTWCNENSPFYPKLISSGFVSEIQKRYLCIKPLSPNIKDPDSLEWYILPADSEVF